MPVVEFGPQLRPAPSPRHTLSSDGNGTSANNMAASSFLVAPDAEADSTTSRRRHTLVPSGFECIAHPVFFRSEPFAPPPLPPPAALSTNALRRAARAPASPRLGDRPNRGATSTSVRASVSAWNEEDEGGLIAALGTEELEGRNHCDTGGGGHTSDGDDATGAASGLGDGSSGGGGAAARGNGGRGGSGSGREVDVECPICLGRFERQVTLTSCLHTFCHTCILGWYEHTVAVALSRGGPSAFRHPERGPAANGSSGGNRGESGGNNGGDNSSSSSSRAPAPYRCPLCKVPGPYFLAVKPAPPAPSPSLRASAAGKGKGKGKSKDKDKSRNKHKSKDRGKDNPKLAFKLLGVRTVLGGGGPASGGVEVEAASGGGGGGGGGGEGSTSARGPGYPTMIELRAAVRTQLAIAAAVSALENGGGVMRPRSGNGAVAVAVAAAGGVGGGEGGGEGSGEDAGGCGSGGGGEERKARGCSGGGGEFVQEESNVTLSRSPGSGDKHRDSSRRSACSGTDPGTSCGNNASNSSTSNRSNGNNRDGDNSESCSSASTYRTSADMKGRSGRRTESRGDCGANTATLTEAAAGAARTSVSGEGKYSRGGGSGRRDRHRSHRKRQEEVASSSSSGDFDSHLASTAAGEGVGGGSGDGGQEERYSGSGSGSGSSSSSNGNSNNAGRSRCAQPERSSASPRNDRHRENRRKRRRKDAEEVDRRGRRSSSACGERRRHQRGDAESGRGMPDSDDVRGSRSSGRVVGSRPLPWEPGSMVAEDALAAIEAMLEREKESLRSRASEPGPSL